LEKWYKERLLEIRKPLLPERNRNPLKPQKSLKSRSRRHYLDP
jgi:hypothetical protein